MSETIETTGNRRIGTIVLATETLSNGKSRAFLADTLFRRFCPFAVSVSPNGALRAFTGFCDDFDEVPDNEPAPRYSMSVSETEGVKTTTFARMPPDAPGPRPSRPEAAPPAKPGWRLRLFGAKKAGRMPA
jgi:hypothetical protein